MNSLDPETGKPLWSVPSKIRQAVSIATPKLQRSIASFDPSLRLSPSVRRLLIETGLDPASIRGTGKGGRITAADVAKVARLARLDVTPDEVERMTAQLAGMLAHFDDIDAHNWNFIGNAPHRIKQLT